MGRTAAAPYRDPTAGCLPSSHSTHRSPANGRPLSAALPLSVARTDTRSILAMR